jgi:hypothetical protein
MQGIYWLTAGELLAIQEGLRGSFVACPGTNMYISSCFSV